MTETARWRLLVSVLLGWSLLVVGLYTTLITSLPTASLRKLFVNTQAFFLWQAVGFFLLSFAVSLVRPRVVGRIAAIYLALSTIVLLGFPRDLSLPLAWLAFTLLGFLAINTMRMALKRFLGAEEATWGIGVGLLYCVLIPLSLLMGVLKLMTAAVALPIVGALVIPGLIDLLRTRRRSQQSILKWLDSLNSIGVFSLGVLWISLAMAFIWATTPETDSDAVRSYLPHIQEIVRDQGFTLQFLDFGRLFTKATIGIHAFGFVAAGSVQGAKWLSWFSVVALALLVVEEVNRRSGQRNLAIFAGATIISCPILLFLSKSLFHDHLIVLPCVAAFVSLFRGLERDSRWGILLSALIMGCAIQTKYNVLIFSVVWVLTLVWCAVRQRGFLVGLKWCALPLLVFAVSGCPWYVYTFATTGNPLFPTFESLFPLASPLAERFSPLGFGSAGGLTQFTIGDSIWDHLFFPWTVTFHSSRMGYANGGMGFQFLALIPALLFCLPLRRERWRAGLDLGLVGFAGLGGVLLRTPYLRYWLPIYPLLLMSLILLLGQSLVRTHWRFPRYIASLAGAALFVALLATVPLWAGLRHGLPWQVYTNEISDEDWITLYFPGYPAIRQLNLRLKSGDRVISTRYPANFTIDTETYELPFGRLKMYGINSAEALRKYLNDNSIDYWVIDHSHMEATYFDERLGASRYWTDESLVAGFGTLAAYDVSSGASSPHFNLLDSRVLKPVLLPPSTPPGQAFDQPGWVSRSADKPELMARPVAGALEIPKGGMVEYRFTMPPTADLCRLKVPVRSDGHGSILRLHWLDADRKRIETVLAGARALQVGHETRFFGFVPEQARYAIFSVTPFHATAIEVGEVKIDFLVVK